MSASPGWRYILDLRIQRAKELLRASKMTVFEASVRTGFADQAHFTKVFRHLVGAAPIKYRRQAGEPIQELVRSRGHPMFRTASY